MKSIFSTPSLLSYKTAKNIPYNVIFTTKFNDSSILISIISWDYMNKSFANEYVGDVTLLTHVIMYKQCCSRHNSQSVAVFTSN